MIVEKADVQVVKNILAHVIKVVNNKDTGLSPSPESTATELLLGAETSIAVSATPPPNLTLDNTPEASASFKSAPESTSPNATETPQHSTSINSTNTLIGTNT